MSFCSHDTFAIATDRPYNSAFIYIFDFDLNILSEKCCVPLNGKAYDI